MITLNHYQRVTLLALLGSWALFAALYGLFHVFITYVDQHPVGLMLSMLLSFLLFTSLVGPSVTVIIATVRFYLDERKSPVRYIMGGIHAIFFGIVALIITLHIYGIPENQVDDSFLRFWWRFLISGIPLMFITGVTLIILLAEFLSERRIQQRSGNESPAQQ